MSRLVLLASPFLGPAVWAPVADLLDGSGWTVSVPRLRPPVGSPADVLRGLLEEIPDEPGLALVPHSNSGLYVAALAADRDVDAVVFVDAGLPAAAPSTPTAPAALRDALAAIVDVDGLLPPWTRWWPDADTDPLFPDLPTRRAVEAEQARLPLTYFDLTVPSPAGWERLPAAYLAFGDTYDEECTEARRRGWPVETLPGEHLHQLVDPQAVAGALTRLLGSLGTT